MTTNKPEVFEVYRTRQGTLENVVLLADYEALQAECEQLRKDAERLDWIVSEGAIVARAGVLGEPHRYRVEWPQMGEVGINWFTSERAAIDAALAELRNQGGE